MTLSLKQHYVKNCIYHTASERKTIVVNTNPVYNCIVITRCRVHAKPKQKLGGVMSVLCLENSRLKVNMNVHIPR